jgi:hypothetical protein
MLITKIPSQLTHALASARLSVKSAISAIRTDLELIRNGIATGNPIGNERPQMALIPVSRRRGTACGHAISANTGVDANTAVRMYADPVTKGWQVLDFGKTTGKTSHSQPSRFAP